jgi:hypothetical protein
MSEKRRFFPAPSEEGESGKDQIRPMQRGVSQLLFNYLPNRTVDWEDGLAIVKLSDIRFSAVWEQERTASLLKEIGESFERWRFRGGRVDREFPADPVSEPGRFAVGTPDSIDAGLLRAADVRTKISARRPSSLHEP